MRMHAHVCKVCQRNRTQPVSCMLAGVLCIDVWGRVYCVGGETMWLDASLLRVDTREVCDIHERHPVPLEGECCS